MMSDQAQNHAFTRIPRWTPPSGGESGTGVHGVRLHAELADGLEHTAERLGTPVEALLLAAHARVLATVAAERDLLLGYVPPTGPGHARPLSLYVTDSTWAELVTAAAEAADREPGALGGVLPEAVLDLTGLAITAVGEPNALPEGAVVRVAWDRDDEGGLALRVLHDRSAVDGTYAERLAGYHLAALRLLVADPQERHEPQSLLTDQECQHLIHGLAGPRVELSELTFVDLFEERVRDNPEAVAVEHRQTRWTYRELDERANRIAHALLSAGVGAEDVVAVVMDRSPDWIAAAIGVFKAGGVYLPVSPDFPAERVAAQLDRSACAFALTEPGSEELVRKAAGTRDLTALSVPGVLTEDGPRHAPRVPIPPDQAAYIYFTSGSTGTPKGALCEHAGFVNHLYMKIDDTGMAPGPGEVVTQIASQCFDISLWQFAAPLVTGGSVRVFDTATQLDVPAFLDELVAGRVTVAQVVPSYLEVLLTRLEQHPRPLGDLRVVSVTGEALKYELVQRWFAACPGIKLINAYGATETSDDAMHEVMDRVPERDFVSVGRSLRNVNTYVLDENLALVPLGSPGEIAFSGVCVGRGYINDEERTRQAFVPDPFRPDTRMYRTGDFGRWLPEGRIEFLGRRDEQVKIRGFRIEIGDIESKLLAMAGVREAAVVVDGTGEQRSLVAFFSAADEEELPAERVREFLATVLPEYMVPTHIHRMERLPLTENGKIDKKSLVRRAAMPGQSAEDAPATPAERRLAQLWSEVLGVPPERIGRSDSFFELGGTSLAAVRFLVRLDRALSLKDLAAHPVLADLAAALDAGATGTAATGLLQQLSAVRDPHRTLVCFPYAGGNAVNFRSLAAELDRDGIAVLGVEPPGHDFTGAGAGEPMLDVPDIARRVRDELAEQVTTPVLLWGQGTGGAAALETARLLADAGRPAERVFLGGLLLGEADTRAAEMAEAAATDDTALLARLRAGNAHVELDLPEPGRAEVVGRAYRHDVLTAGSRLIRLREDTAAYRIDAPVDVVVARDDPAAADYAQGYGDWKAVSDHVTILELEQGGPYFVSTRPVDAADVVRLRCARPGAPAGPGASTGPGEPG
ncbi:amino acid adenylation domain-containing protein [Streptomyces cyaneochromogenes]|uniref:Amino acid adenylation domain-containing protein n=1 Tax=Streptomyces cyaneochromogenes TaxID=2496836 RepID=A0A3S5HT66_9ACTN|nr:amino acid adenylation domain-containing protein [Streptomyces cyaneochromogenes]AZQ32232.1 amino acid adenylation domain-containing protein [Streptomyces cyaneochromogenes]